MNVVSAMLETLIGSRGLRADSGTTAKWETAALLAVREVDSGTGADSKVQPVSRVHHRTAPRSAVAVLEASTRDELLTGQVASVLVRNRVGPEVGHDNREPHRRVHWHGDGGGRLGKVRVVERRACVGSGSCGIDGSRSRSRGDGFFVLDRNDFEETVRRIVRRSIVIDGDDRVQAVTEAAALLACLKLRSGTRTDANRLATPGQSRAAAGLAVQGVHAFAVDELLPNELRVASFLVLYSWVGQLSGREMGRRMDSSDGEGECVDDSNEPDHLGVCWRVYTV